MTNNYGRNSIIGGIRREKLKTIEKKMPLALRVLFLFSLLAVTFACSPKPATEPPTTTSANFTTEETPTLIAIESSIYEKPDATRQKVLDLAGKIQGISILNSTSSDQLSADQKTILQQFQDSQQVDINVLAQNTPGAKITLSDTQVISATTSEGGSFEVGFSTLLYSDINNGNPIGNALTYQFKDSNGDVINAALLQDQEQTVNGKTVRRFIALPGSGPAFPAVIAVYDNLTDTSPSQVYVLWPDGTSKFNVLPLQGSGSEIKAFSGQAENISFKIARPTPIIEVDGLKIPDPKASNPEFFNLTSPDSPIFQFANAFGVKPEEVGNLTPQLLTGVDGKQFVVLTTGNLAATANFDETGIPLLMSEQEEDGEWVWSKTTLKMLAEKGNLEIGVAGLYADISTAPIIEKYFNLLVSDWEFHWNTTSPPLRPDIDSFNFRFGDDIINYSQRKNIPLQVHHLLFGDQSALPNWLLQGNFSRDQLLTIIQNHVRQVVSRYKGKVSEWTVINEIYGVPWNGSFWYERLGSNTDWIELAFKTTHEIDPSAKLILNDAGIEFYGGDPLYGRERANNVFNLVKTLIEKGVPIEGVGFQMHLYGKDLLTQQQIDQRIEALKKNIKRYQEIGIDVYITEFDIRMNGVQGTQEERFRIQAQAYEAITKAAIESGVTSISIFGVKDKDSWLENPNIAGPDAKNSDPLLFDDNGLPKPSYFTIIKALLEKFK
jgi:endo-1,4-beta-xylanase